MLREISIRDVVLIEALDLEIADGFIVLTGETGAGKSILLDALGLALSERADKGLVRNGAIRAIAGATFDIKSNLLAKEIANEFDIETENDQIILYRSVSLDGKSQVDNSSDGFELSFGSLHLLCGTISAALKYEAKPRVWPPSERRWVMAEKPTSMPMSAGDAVACFQCCGDAFACLSTIMGAIQDDDNPSTTDALIVAGIHVADRFARLTNTWRYEATAGGRQP